MKYRFLFLFLLVALSFAPPLSAADSTTRRRPDQPEFVTESHVRLTTESLSIAEVQVATPAAQPPSTLWDYLTQSFSAFVQSLRDIFSSNNSN